MKKTCLLLFLPILSILTYSCSSSNEDVDIAFRAACSKLTENVISQHAYEAYAVFDELNAEDICKLTLTYYYLSYQYSKDKYFPYFKKCLETAVALGTSDELFYKLSGEENAYDILKNFYDNPLNLEDIEYAMSSAVDKLDFNNIENEPNLPDDEIQTGNMAFVNTKDGMRRYYSQYTYSGLSDTQKNILKPLGVVLINRSMSIILANSRGSDPILSWNEATEYSSNYEPDDKNGKWRLMTLSEAKQIHESYDEIIDRQISWNELTKNFNPRIYDDIGGYSIYIDHTNGDLASTTTLYDLNTQYHYKWTEAGGIAWYVSNLN